MAPVMGSTENLLGWGLEGRKRVGCHWREGSLGLGLTYIYIYIHM